MCRWDEREAGPTGIFLKGWGWALQNLIHSGFQGFVFDIRFCLEASDTRLPQQVPRTLIKARPGSASHLVGAVGPSLPFLGLSGLVCKTGKSSPK